MLHPVSLLDMRKRDYQRKKVVTNPRTYISPCLMNRLKIESEHKILEEKRFCIDREMDKYPNILEAMKFHKFEQFCNPPTTYVPSWAMDLY